MIKIAFDIDGCVVNINKQFEDILYNRYNIGPFGFNGSPPKWSLIESYGISEELVWDILAEIYMNPAKTPIIDGARELLEQLYFNNKKEDPIQFVTARPKWTASMTYSLIDRIIPDIDYQIAFANHKVKYLKDYPIIMEDSPINVKYFLEQKKTVFMPRYLYNREVNISFGLIKIDSIKDLQYFYGSLIG